VGTYAIVPVLSDPDGKLGNYSVTGNSGVLTITKAPATVTLGGLNPVYDGTARSVTVATVPAGLAVNVTYSGSAAAPTDAGSYLVVGTLVDANYLGAVTNTLVISKAGLTVTADNKSRAYGATNPMLTATITGFVNGQTLASSGVTGSPDLSTSATTNSPVGAYPIQISQGTLSSANYSFSFTNGLLSVSSAPLTVSANSSNRVYGAANPIFNGTVSGLRNGDNITATYTTTANASSPVGTYAIVPVLGDPDGKLGNYSVTTNNGVLTVTKAPLTVTADNKSRAYGVANPLFTGTLSGVQPGDNITAAYTTTANASSPVGTYAIVPVLSDPDGKLGNYSVTGNSGVLTITKAPLTVTADNKSRAYGVANPLFTGTLSGVQGGDNITATYTTTANASSPVGTYAIVPVLSDPDGKLGNYSVTGNSGVLTITKAPLTVAADNKSRAYGVANPLFTGTVNGMRPGDNITATYTTTANASSPVGTYAIVPVLNDPDGKLGNYIVTTTVGVLTITPIARPEILSLIGAGTTNVVITWTAMNNVVYRVQYRPDLNSGNWLDLVPDVTATNSTASAVDNPGGSRQRFYRILVVP
jgi:hypothetical protein